MIPQVPRSSSAFDSRAERRFLPNPRVIPRPSAPPHRETLRPHFNRFMRTTAAMPSVAGLPEGAGPSVRPTLLHEEALARCEFLIEGRRPFGVLAGPAGCGKTHLLRELRAGTARPSKGGTLLLEMTGVDDRQFLRELADNFGLGLASDDSSLLLRAIRDRVEGESDCGRPTLLLLDHLDAAGEQALRIVRLLLNVAAASKSLTVIAAARHPLPAAVQALLDDFGSVRIELRPLAETETAQFVDAMLSSGGPPCSTQALAELQRLTAGQPRQLERLCELLRLAREVDAASLTPEMIRAAGDELPAPTTGARLQAHA